MTLFASRKGAGSIALPVILPSKRRASWKGTDDCNGDVSYTVIPFIADNEEVPAHLKLLTQYSCGR